MFDKMQICYSPDRLANKFWISLFARQKFLGSGWVHPSK